MTTSIHFMNGLYAIEREGEFVDVASTYHDAEVISASMDEAHHSGMIGGDPLLIEAQRFGERGSICAACEDQAQPCAVCSTEPWRIGRRCPTCGDEGDCPDCGDEGDCPDCGDEGDCPDCGEVHCECDDDYSDAMAEHAMGTYNGKVPSDFTRPLLTQCAAAIDACLGGPVANGGILDELRRVRAELKKAGV